MCSRRQFCLNYLNSNRIRYSPIINHCSWICKRCRLRRHCVFGLSVCCVHSFVCPFVQKDLITTISHEWLEQSRCHLQGIHTDDLIWFWRSKVKVTAGRRGPTCIHVDQCQSPSSIYYGWPFFSICKLWSVVFSLIQLYVDWCCVCLKELLFLMYRICHCILTRWSETVRLLSRLKKLRRGWLINVCSSSVADVVDISEWFVLLVMNIHWRLLCYWQELLFSFSFS